MLSKPGGFIGPKAGIAGGGGPVWTPISWDNHADFGTLTNLGNGGIQKTAGPDQHWNTVATSNTHFTSFPVQLRFKVSAGIFACGFANQASNNLTSFSSSSGTVDGLEEQETWSVGQFTSPGANGTIDVFDNSGTFTSTTGTQDQTDYLYLKVDGSGVVTLVYQNSTIHTFSANAGGKTLIPFAAIWNLNMSITESAWFPG